MVRSPGSIRGRVADAQNEGSSSEGASSGSGLRKLLLGLGLAAVAFAVVRKLRSDSRPTDESDEWYQLSIEESVDADEDETAGAGEEDAATAGVEQGASDEKLPDDASTDVGVEEDVETEPAEPGEMTVDEEVVEEMTDEGDETGASSESENDEEAAGANDATDDEGDEEDEA